MKKFLDCISIVGATPSKFHGTKKYVSTGAVATTEIDESEVVEVTYEDRPSRANLSAEAGDILFAKMQGTRKTLLLDSETEENIYSTGFYAVRANPEVITTECLYYLIDSELFLAQKDKNCSGATQKAITNGGMAKIEISVPALSEQGILVNKLKHLTQLIADKKKQLNLFDEIIKSRFIEMFGDPVTNPLRWAMLPLEKCLTVLGGYAFKSEEFKTSGVPVLRIGNINTGAFTPTNMVYWSKDDCLTRYQVLPGDLVISLTGTVGKDDYGNVCILGDGRTFDIPELKLLIDAVESSKFISASKSLELVKKLGSLTSNQIAATLTRNVSCEGRIKSGNEKIYLIIDTINEAINSNRQISFQYFQYNVRKEQQLKHNGEPYVITPLHLVWNGDYYYMIGVYAYKQRIGNFRVDRIAKRPKILDAEGTPAPEGFNIDEYINTTFKMFNSEHAEVELVCDNEVMDSIIDKFGAEVTTYANDMTSFRAVVNVAVNHVFLSWVFGFGGKVKFKSPEAVREKYSAMIKNAFEEITNAEK